MRIFVGVAVLCLAGVSGLLFVRADGRGALPERRTVSPVPPDVRAELDRAPEPLPDIRARIAARPRAPRSQEELEGFVALCARRGEEVVPELRALLRSGADVTLRTRWELTGDGRTKGYPTLRAAILDALAQIPGRASADVLRSVVAEPRSIQEACVAAHALHRRRAGGWVDAALEQAAGKTGAVALPFQRRLVELAAGADPAAATERLIESAPRGGDGADPKVLASALVHLPAAEATRAAWALLGERTVTPRAKARYVRALCERPAAAPEIFRELHDVAAGADWPSTLKADAANAAANATAFLLDEQAWLRARARGDETAAAAVRRRFEARLVAVERLVHGLVGADPSDPRAAAVLRTLDRHRQRLR